MTNLKYTKIAIGDTILVTGANGFIGAHVVRELLNNGYVVKAMVRSQKKFDKLKQCFQSSPNLTPCIVEDISDFTSLVDAVKECDGVIHLASPFVYKATNFEEDLMKPALEGTIAMLKACLTEPRIKRMILTSSFAAIYDASQGQQPGKAYTEEDWSPLTWDDGVNTTEVSVAYRASKTVAERQTWEFMKKEQPQFDLTVMCPSMVFGPLVSTILIDSIDDLNVSNSIIWTTVNSEQIPPTKAPLYVDVRDVAHAQLKALTLDIASNSRYLLSAGDYDTQEIADIAREHFSDKVPLGTPGSRLSGTHYTGDSTKARRELGIEFKELQCSVLDLCEQLSKVQAQH